ncbi:MAG: hypothetical protein IJ315_02385 [Firmicutes bacterium]|nr:hypothetical protein [Bacillota bacterium]
MKKFPFWCSLAVSILLFVITLPFSHDMYIAPLFTVICVCLGLMSSVLFGIILYQVLSKRFLVENYGTFLGFIILQGVAHAGFAMMNWGSWLFLGITVVVLVGMAVSYVKAQKS